MNNNKSDKEKDPMEAISGAYIDWGRSKDLIWMQMENKIETSESTAVRFIFAPWMKIAMAAVITILVGFSALLQLYTKTVTIPAGQHSQAYLPDNSVVELNSQSAISYKPILYKFSRIVKFDGEAYFEIQKGKKFEVISEYGKTDVLGTSFNIYSRNNDYHVTCITGSVKVTETTHDKAVILQPGQKATLNKEGMLFVQSGLNKDQALSWLENKLNFTSVPLSKVFEEIGRQYGILINIPENLDSVYSGTFYTNTPVAQTLDLVCKPFHLTYVVKSKDEYTITRNEQKINQ